MYNVYITQNTQMTAFFTKKKRRSPLIVYMAYSLLTIFRVFVSKMIKK